MKTETIIRIITLTAMIVLIGTIVFVSVYVYSYREGKCIANPVDYANNNSELYWWDYVQPIKVDVSGGYG